jgi:hypothetical protein
MNFKSTVVISKISLSKITSPVSDHSCIKVAPEVYRHDLIVHYKRNDSKKYIGKTQNNEVGVIEGDYVRGMKEGLIKES